MPDVNKFAATAKEVSTVIAEQDSNSRQIKWVVKVMDEQTVKKMSILDLVRTRICNAHIVIISILSKVIIISRLWQLYFVKDDTFLNALVYETVCKIS